MSYTKTTNPSEQAVADALTAIAAQQSIVGQYTEALTAAQGTVTLDTGETVWCACIFADDPYTPNRVELLGVAAQFTDGALATTPAGKPVCSVWRPSVQAQHLASYTGATIRKAVLMVLLGEPQPQVPISNPSEGGPTEQDVFSGAGADTSIRTIIGAAGQLSSAEDVL